MESPVPYSRGLGKHSLSIMKQGRSGYDPSDTETELHEAPWNEFNKKNAELGSDEVRNLNSVRLVRRQSSKFDPEGLPPPRRHSKSPYKNRRDGKSSRSPTPGPLPLPPGRNISPFSKSERRSNVSPFKLARGDDALENDEQGAGSYNKPKHRQFNNESYARALSAPRLRSKDKDQQIKHDQRVSRRDGRSRTPPLRRSITPRKDKDVHHKNTPSVGEINEMVANAKLAKSPVRHAPVFDSTDSLPGGDIFFSRDYAAASAQKIKNSALENRINPKPKAFTEKKPDPHHRYNSNGVHNYNTTGVSSSGMLTPTTMASSSAISKQSSHISDASGKSNGSSWRFTASRRKSQTDTWFSCMKGSCSTGKKSPERLRAFDEASFIEKAFVVENVRQFWADKYQPLSLNGFTCHKQEALQLKHLASQEIFPHILLKGPQGLGKKALTMALLCEIYGDAARNISHDLKYFKIQETRSARVAVPITSSPHHVELNVHLEANARYALMASVKQISSDHAVTPETSTVNLKPDYTVMVLYDVDKADESIQHLIKWIMDCYSDVCKLVLCCEDDVSILDPVKTRCHIITLDAPVTHEVMEVLIQISRKENFDLPMKFAAKIANKSKQNTRKAIMALEACKSHNYPFVEDQPIPIGWEYVLVELAAEILADPSHKRLFLIRGKLQKLLVEFVHPKLILLKLIEQFLKSVEANVKKELYYWHGYYDKRLPVGTSALLKLEEFVAKFMSIHRKTLQNRQ
ncbi:putative DNA polymerase III, clamp loader complex, gamma/delta/delta subunit [Helianthus annuus]|nr:putative DNA polymerase III, clamp loader complex, gamma/delta/delta subunit [Helianthus annuus]